MGKPNSHPLFELLGKNIHPIVEYSILLRGESRKFKSVESWMKYVSSKLFPRFVVTLRSTTKE
jgi:hypothetical protein